MRLSPIRNTPRDVVDKVQTIFRDVVKGKSIPEITDRVVPSRRRPAARQAVAADRAREIRRSSESDE